MAKRGAEFQMTKDNDGAFAMAADGSGSIQPQRATAQQMAKRKIATTKRTRVTPSPGPQPGGPAPDAQPSSFSFGAPPQTNGWSGSFGATSTSFSGGIGAATSSTVAEAPNNNMFGGSTPSFGSGAVSAAPPVKFDFAASGNPFTFGASSTFGANNNNNGGQDATINKAPTFNFGSNNAPLNNHAPSPPPSTTPTSSTPAASNPFFASAPASSAQSTPALSTSDAPKSPFGSSGNIFAPMGGNNTTSFGGFKPTHEKTDSHALTREEIERIQKFCQEIGQKYATAEAFLVKVRAELDGLVRDGKAGDLLNGTSKEAQADKFVNELQSLQPQLDSSRPGTPLTMPNDSYQILSSMMSEPSPATTPRNPFASQETNTPASTSNLFTSQQPTPTAPSTTQPSKPTFSFSNPSAQPVAAAANPFAPPASQSKPAPASSPVDPSELRAKLVKKAVETAQKSHSNVDTLNKVRDAMSGALAEIVPDLRLDRFPVGTSDEDLQVMITNAVGEAYEKLNVPSILSDAEISRLVDILLPKITSTILAAVAKGMKDAGIPASERPADPLLELRRIRRECEQIQPPPTLPNCSVKVADLNETQKKQLTFAYRMSLLNRAVGQLSETPWLQPLEQARLQQEYDSIVASWQATHGVKRKAHGADQLGSNKRHETAGQAAALMPSGNSLFSSTANKRPADVEESSTPAKRPREASTTPTGSPNASHTSQLFASIAGDQPKSSLFSSTPSAQSQSNIGSGLFSASGNSAAPSANIFTSANATPSKPASSSLFGANTTSSKPSGGGFTPQGGFKPASGTSSGTNFFAQFQKQSSDTEAKAKEKRKLEDYDSEEETEEEWEKRDAEEQAKKRQKLQEAAQISSTFIFKPTPPGSASDAGKGNEADNEESDESGSSDDDNGNGEENGDGHDDEHDESDHDEDGEDSSTPAAAPGRSLFDRVTKDNDAGSAKPTTSPAVNKTWKPDTPIKFGTANTNPNDSTPTAAATSIFGTKTASEAAAGQNPFSSSATTKAPEANKNPFGTFSSGPTTASNSNPFGSFPASSAAPSNANPFSKATTTAPSKEGQNGTTPTFNFISASPQKDDATKSSGGLFSNPKAASSQSTSLFGSAGANANASGDKPKSLFGFSTGDNAQAPKTFENPFAKLAKPGALQSIADAQAASNSLSPGSIFASAGTSRATSPGMTTGDESTGSAGADEATPDPQLDLASSRSGEEGEEALFEVRAKGSELVSVNGSADKREWTMRGVGELRLLKSTSTGKCRLLLRAGPASRVVLNTALISSIPHTKPTPKSVSLTASMGGALSKWTLQVGKAEDASKLFDLIEEHKDNGA